MGIAFELGLRPDIQVGNIQDSGWHFKRILLPVAMSIGHIYKSHHHLAALIMPPSDKLSRGDGHPVKNCDTFLSKTYIF